MKTGNIIRTLRTVQKMSQGTLADKLNVTRAYLSQVENGHRQPSLALLKQVATNLGVPLILLVAAEEEGIPTREIRVQLQEIFYSLLSVSMAKLTNLEAERTESFSEEAQDAQH